MTRAVSLSRTATIFFPLAVSGFLMSFAQHIIIAGIARLPDPETSLAAYGISLSLSIFIESPVIVLLSVANALVRDRASYLMLRRFAIWVGLGISALQALITFTPLHHLVFRIILGLPADVAAAARIGFAFLVPWHFFIAWRRFLQGILINQGVTGPIGWGTGLRLVTLLVSVFAGVWLYPKSGVAVATFALTMSVFTEAVYTTWWGWKVVPNLPAQGAGQPLTYRQLSAFFWPLAMQAFIGNLLKPAVAGALARSAVAAVSLAVWPVAQGTVALFLAPINMLQQMAIAARGEDRVATMRFSAIVGAVTAGALVLFGFTPLGRLYLGEVIGLQEPALDYAVWGLRLLFPLPLLVAAQNWLSGSLVRSRRALAVQQAVLFDLAFVAAAIYPAALFLPVPGAILAPLAVCGGMAVEVAVLKRALEKVSTDR